MCKVGDNYFFFFTSLFPTVLLLWYVCFVSIKKKIVEKDGKAVNVILPYRRN